MKQTVTCPIVGMHFRPPAKALLAFLPSGAQIALALEPDNPYDANAVKVLVGVDQIPADLHDALQNAAAGYGHDLETLREGSPWHLGYIGRDYAAELAPRLAAQAAGPDARWPAQLLFDGAGKPLAAVELEIGGGE